MSAVQTKRGLVGNAKEIVGRAKSVARLQAQLAQLEIKQKLVKIGIGAGLAVVALILTLYAIGFLFAGAAAGLAYVVPWWAALLIVGGVLRPADRLAALPGPPLDPLRRAAGPGRGDRGGPSDHRDREGECRRLTQPTS